MKKFLKRTGVVVLILILLIGVAAAYIKIMLPNVGSAPELKIDNSAAVIERGAYLANHVMVCMDCHSGRDWSKFSGPLVPGTLGQGGEVFDANMGFPGRFISSNITPHFLSDWTDGEIFRAVTTGVAKNGRALFNIMPYLSFGKLDEEDIKSVIAYLRTLEKVEKENETSKADFPVNFILNTIPQKAAFTKRPEKTDTINYGKYLVAAANCAECHTKMEKGKPVGEPFAGGFEFGMPGGVVTSPNLTPHETGMKNYTLEMFLSKFKMYTDSNYVLPAITPGTMQTPMPWTMYAGMTEEDLTAIYKYLQSLPAVNNTIVKFRTTTEK